MCAPRYVSAPLLRTLRISAALLLVALVPACSSATREPRDTDPGAGEETFYVRFRDNPGYSEVIDFPVQQVWAALPHAFADLNYKGGPSTKPGEHVYLTPHMTIPNVLYAGSRNSEFIDCGRTAANVEAADEYSVTFAILAGVSPHESGRTKVEVLVDGSAIQRGTSSNRVPCSGTGRLERELVQALKKRLATS